MRRDTGIGIILGILIIVIILVFLSTRTKVNEPQVSGLILSKGDTGQHEIVEIKGEEILEIVPEDSLIKEESQIVEELQYAEKPAEIDNSQIADKTLDIDEEEIIPEDDQQAKPIEISTKTIYKVKSGDSLFKIAKEYLGDETKWDIIFEANRDSISNLHVLYVGQELLIPDVKVERTETGVFRVPAEEKQDQEKRINTITYTVQSGDTLYRIAEEYYDDPEMWEKIYKANEETIESRDLLRKGQVLIIP